MNKKDLVWWLEDIAASFERWVFTSPNLAEFLGSLLFLFGLYFGSASPKGSMCFLIGSILFAMVGWAKCLRFMFLLNVIGTCIIAHGIWAILEKGLS